MPFSVLLPRKEAIDEMTLNGINRAPAMLLGAAIAGGLLWVAGAYIGRHSTGGYWAAYGIVAGAGLAFGLLRGTGGHPPAMFLLVFVPVVIAAGWVIVAMQPANTTSTHVMRWSSDIGIADVVRDLGTWLGVLAFSIGFTLAAALEPFGVRRARTVEHVAPLDRRAADEPTAAERREVAARDHEAATTVDRRSTTTHSAL
jgi:hypothetical protein